MPMPMLITEFNYIQNSLIRAVVFPRNKIELYTYKNNTLITAKSFLIGDTAIVSYVSRRLPIISGTITSIAAKSISINIDPHSPSKRLNLINFAYLNCDPPEG